ncbi:MAG: hypothetical protein IKU17_07835, partial [Clostridia bacterium]|nr:hypothetical protein [Clostridia bacterium]
MQNYEEYTRISRVPVIIPPSGEEKPTEDPQPEQEQPPDLFRPAAPLLRQVRKKYSAVDKVLLVQSVLCGLILAALLALQVSSPAAFETMRNWYNEQLY